MTLTETRKEILTAVQELMNWNSEKALAWYKAPNAGFDNVTPQQMVLCDRGHKVLHFIRAVKGERIHARDSSRKSV